MLETKNKLELLSESIKQSTTNVDICLNENKTILYVNNNPYALLHNGVIVIIPKSIYTYINN